MTKILHQRIISINFLIAIVLLAISTIYYSIEHSHRKKENENIMLSYQTMRAANQTLLSLGQALLRLNTYTHTHDPAIIKKIPEYLEAAKVNFQTLSSLIADNSYETSLYHKTQPLFDEKIKLLSQVYQEDVRGNLQSPILLDSALDNINENLHLIKSEELKQLTNSSIKIYTNTSSVKKMMYIFGILCSAFFLLSFIHLNYYFKRF